MNKDFVYDIETYPNVFTFCAVYMNGNGLRVFEVSDRKDDTVSLLEFLRNVKTHGCRMVGFNNVGFDYPVIHHILQKSISCKKTNTQLVITAKEMYDVAMGFIKNNSQFGSAVKQEDVLLEQVDLYKINHFDNKAKATSLKMLEFNMRSENIEDLPFPVGKILTNDEIDVLIKYNKHDVLQTLKFYNFNKEAMNLRAELTKKFGFDCTNFNDTKIGKELFIRSLEKASPGCCYMKTQHGRKVKQTKRDKIVIGDCLLPYLEFERPEFKAIHQWFKDQVITETKGVFSDLLEHQLGDVAKYAEMVIKQKKINDPVDSKNKKYVPTEEHIASLRKEQPLGWVEEKELKSPKGAKSYYWCYQVSETLNVVINGFRLDFGLGGIHGARQGIIRSNDKRTILTYDVASYYPNLAISNNIYPQHLGNTFCKVYKQLYEERKSTPKGSPANAALKLALNGTYGETNNEFSPLYDPAYTMSITIGGQLSLCMLIEKVVGECGADMLMANTDGCEFVVDNDKIDRVKEIVVDWEKLTGLTMEGDVYESMFIRDVNSYISVNTSGKVKLKGAYEYMDYTKLGWHKNHSAMVIPQAVEHELLGRGKAEDYILNHKNEFDFMLRTKVDRNSRLILVYEGGIAKPLQNICRYYPSVNGGKLVKIMPPLPGKEADGERRLSIDSEWNVTPCNDMKEFNWDIDYRYYITQSRKLIDQIQEINL